ncbi:hypothetical protein ACFY05_41920 [Microtetraspora fusca]|uniref:DUF222 domain-containing protein n=1 Tax=Microtetraspora fusca TaxID=1997 RepID=A0ABW6VMC0_MICFU
MTDVLRRNAFLVDALGSSMRSGDHGLKTVPGLLRKILSERSWREFITQRGLHVRHERFVDFVQAPPLKGLGATMELIDRIVGRDDPELLALLRDAKRVGRGHRRDSDSESLDSETAAYTATRLAAVAPDELAAVQRGEKSIHAAALAAGIRRRRVPVRLDSAESAAKTLRAHMEPDELQKLARLLTSAEE